MPADASARTTHTKKEKCNELETTATGEGERAWYRAKARAEQAADRVSDCERRVSRLREELNCTEVPGNTPLQIGRSKKMPKKLKGILVEVNGGVVSYVQFNGKPVTAYHILDWDELLGDSDTRRTWEGLSTEEQEFIRDRYPIEFAAIQERLKEEAGDGATQQS
jgi:hypothetical protein